MSLKTDYLQLESNLMLKLRKAWAPTSSVLYADMTELVEQAKFDEARALVSEIDLEPIALANREYLKYTMWGYAILGATQASDRKPLITGMAFEETMGHVTDLLVQSLALNATTSVQDTALQSIANAEAEYSKTQKADQPRFVKEFVSFANKGDEMMRMVSALHSTRLAAWGFLAEADLLGIQKYRLTAVLDNRTSEFCRLINGKIFMVEDAQADITRILSAQQPDDLKVLQPWPKQDKDSMAAFKKMTAKQLTEAKLHLPPFHPYCRTMLIKLKKDSKPIKVKPLALPESTKALSTTETFDELGIKLTNTEVEAWNNGIGASPVLVLAKLSGVEPAKMLEGYLKGIAPVKFTKDGNISLKGKTAFGTDAKVNTHVIFDPFTRDFYLNYAEMQAADPKRAHLFFKQLNAQLTEAAQVAGATTFTIQAGGSLGIYSYTKMGFAPNAQDWMALKEDLLVELAEGGKFFEQASKLTAEKAQVLNDLLSSNDPKALVALTQLPWRFGQAYIGKALLTGKELKMSVETGVDNA